ncbi:MAG: hypothetical protein JO041_03655, partial [Acidobacteria bacterium]|nr:hypothetical protein [Acidobacteriota bacterium]
HPSTDAPRLGTAVALAFRSPDPPALLRLLHGIGIEAEVQNGNEPRIVATIETQAGKRVEIT